MVGAGTVRIDDPSLNCRLKTAPRIPVRIVVDPRLTTSPRAKLMQYDGKGRDAEGFPAGPPWFLAGSEASQARESALTKAGGEVLRLKVAASRRAEFLKEGLERIRKRGVNRLLVEGGSGLHTAFIEAGLADQLWAFIAPRVVGGEKAPSAVEGRGRVPMSEAVDFTYGRFRSSGADILFRGFFPWSASS